MNLSLRQGLLASIVVLLCGRPASAGVTVDLVWRDSGTSTLTVTSAGDAGASACAGFQFSGSGRCMDMIWRVGPQGLRWGSITAVPVGSNLLPVHAATFPSFKEIPVGKSVAFRGTGADIIEAPTRVFINAAVNPFTEDPTALLPQGTYTIATIVWDTTSGGLVPGGWLIGSDYAEFGDTVFDPGALPTVVNQAALNVTAGVAAAVPALAPWAGASIAVVLGWIGLARRRRR